MISFSELWPMESISFISN